MNNYLSNFPLHRPRRLRKNKWIRNLVRENTIGPDDFIFPIFVTYKNKSTEIKSMPGVKRLNFEEAFDLSQKAKELGINAVIIFPEVPSNIKDESGKEALNRHNIVCRLVEKN